MKSILLAALLVVSLTSAACQPIVPGPQVNILNLKVHEEANRRIISWTTDGSQPVNTFEVQRSEDGKTFTTIALVLGADPREATELYKFPEKLGNDEGKAIWYRIAHVSVTGEVNYSNSIALAK